MQYITNVTISEQRQHGIQLRPATMNISFNDKEFYQMCLLLTTSRNISSKEIIREFYLLRLIAIDPIEHNLIFGLDGKVAPNVLKNSINQPNMTTFAGVVTGREWVIKTSPKYSKWTLTDQPLMRNMLRFVSSNPTMFYARRFGAVYIYIYIYI